MLHEADISPQPSALAKADIAPSPRYMRRVTLSDHFMTPTVAPVDPLEMRRRKARFRAWHRGMREMDLILGGFADRELDHLLEPELAFFERLMEINDQDLLAWVTGEARLPAALDTPLFRRIAGHRQPPGT